MTYTAPSAAAPSPPGIARSLLSRLEALLNAAGDRDRVRRDAGLAFLVRVASAALMYLSQILLARWMGAFDYGIYVFVWTFVLVLGGLSHLGLSMVAMRLLPQYRETGEAALARGLLFASRATALGVGTLVALAGVGALYLFGDRLAAGYLWPAYLALICLPVYALSDVQDGIGRGRGWMIAGLVPPYILRPLLVLIGMVAAHGVGLPMVAATAVGAAIVATWAAVVIQTLMLARRLRRDGPAGPRQYDLSRWLRVGAPLLAIYACELVFQNADVLIVSAYLTPVEVAMYFAASKTIGLVMFIHYAVGSAAASRFAALAAHGDREALDAAVRDAVAWTFWPSLAAAVLLLALGKPLLWLFSPQFVDGYPVMIILVVGLLARASVGPSEFLLNMLGEQRLCAAVLLATALLAIVLNVVLVPRFGILGAAAATSLSMTLAAVMNAIVARRRLGMRVWIVQNLRPR